MGLAGRIIRSKLGRLNDRQVGRPLALENATQIKHGLAIAVGKMRSIADEAARGDEFALKIDHRYKRGFDY
jgi:hypothetical protein